MPAYAKFTFCEFVEEDPAKVVGCLQQAYAADGFATQYTRQTKAWARIIPGLQQTFCKSLRIRPDQGGATILLEYPLYRLRRRIDVVLLIGNSVIVLECKVGAD